MNRTNDNYTKLHTFPREQIIFLCMALFKLVASSSEEKVADLSEQCSRRVSSVVGAYWNLCSIHVGDTLLYYAVSWFNLPPHIHVFFSYTFPIPFSSGHVAGTFLLVCFLLFLNKWYKNWQFFIFLGLTICYFHNSNRLLELIHESKSLLRLGIQLPESAEDVLKQVIESEYKMYKCSL